MVVNSMTNVPFSIERYLALLFLLLYGTHFLGFVPIAGLYPSAFGSMLPVILISLFFAFYKKGMKNEYTKWLMLLALSLVGNVLSAKYFRGLSVFSAVSGQLIVLYLFFFFLIAEINPTVEEMLRCMKFLGVAGLVLYFAQQILLPYPILESVAWGWRSKAEQLDLRRFEVTGEAFIYMYGLYCMNCFLLKFRKKDLLIVLTVLSMCVLRGYRGYIFAFLLANVYIYFRIPNIKKRISYIVVAIVALYALSFLPIFADVLSFMQEKNTSQTDKNLVELDRAIEFHYFFNDYLKSPLEWIFGSGFMGKDGYLNNHAEYNFINWVDLGFVGMSFMGGLAMVFCWIRLLCLNFRKNFEMFYFLGGLSVYFLLGSVVMTAAFGANAAVPQAFAFFLFYKTYRQYRLQRV